MTLDDYEKMVQTAVAGLKLAQSLTHVGGEGAADALAAISVILESLIAGHTGAITPEQAKADIDVLMSTLAQQDAAADTALHQKFDVGGKP